MHDTPKAPGGAANARSPYVLLFIMLVVAAIATWIIPAGQFDHVVRDGVSFAVPNSLHATPQQGAMPLEVFTAIAKGLVGSAPIIFLILFTGGALAVLERTGAIEQALQALARNSKLGDFSILLIFSVVFGILGTTGVVINAVVAFVPIGLLVARSLGLNPMFGLSLVYLTCAAGFNVAISSPATTGLTQRLAQLPLFSGMGLRSVTCGLFVIATLVFLTIYLRVCRRRGEVRPTFDAAATEANTVTTRQWLILAFAAVSLGTFIFGATQWKWGEAEMTAMFVFVALGAGLMARMNGSQIANSFLEGCAKLVSGALIVGMARAISLMLESGHILDPMVAVISAWLAPLHSGMAAIGMFMSAAMMHFAVSSGSGEAALLIPIYTPIGDAIGLTRQVTVQAVLLGEGIVNCINPTSGVLMGALATAGIPFGKWLRFIAPLIAVWFVICVVTLVIGVAIHWGPL